MSVIKDVLLSLFASRAGKPEMDEKQFVSSCYLVDRFPLKLGDVPVTVYQFVDNTTDHNRRCPPGKLLVLLGRLAVNQGLALCHSLWH
jgi:hypothetical protein